jgi:histidine triad (HIT) family protein
LAVTDCIFCRIARGEIPSRQVAESKEVLAFHDLHPQAPTHILLIPRRHVAASAAELTPTEAPLLGEIFTLAARIAAQEGLASGWRLVTNVGPDAGQSVFHLHFHLLGGAPLGRFGT